MPIHCLPIAQPPFDILDMDEQMEVEDLQARFEQIDEAVSAMVQRVMSDAY